MRLRVQSFSVSQLCIARTKPRRERGKVAAQLARMRSNLSRGFS
jgi:hypothetical protein